MPTITTTVTSRTGTSELFGRSGYSSDLAPYDAGNPSAWEGQGRKWRTVTQTGLLTKTVYFGTGVACQKPVYSESNGTWTGSATESSGTFDYSTLTATGTWTGGLSNRLLDQYDIHDILFNNNYTLIEFAVAGKGACDILDVPTDSYQSASGIASESLTDAASYYDSLASAIDLVTGTTKVASSVSISSTTPESDDPIDFEVTAVRISVLIDGVKDTPHLVTINLINTEGFSIPSTFVLTTDDSEISGQGTGQASFDYDILQPLVDQTITFTGATVREAYPQRALTTEQRLENLETP